MNVFVVGINHKTAPIEVREKFLITHSRYDEFDKLLNSDGIIQERTILSTCNRTEIYGVSADPEEAYHKVIRSLSTFTNLDALQFTHQFYFKTAPDSIDHLFSVASGLDSMALGETQILGQVKNAYLKAVSLNATGKVLNTLFQRSLSVGKQVRSRTDIGVGKVSVASIAIDLATRIFSNLSTKKIMLVGSGEVASLVCESLMGHGLREFIVANRNRDRALQLVRRFGGKEISFDHLDLWMPEVDILITSVGSSCTVLGKARINDWMRHKHGKALFVIDLGVPRNVESDVSKLPDVYLYNIDDLKSIAGYNVANRQQSVENCRRIISRATRLFTERFEKIFETKRSSSR